MRSAASGPCLSRLLALPLAALLSLAPATAETWSIPLAGNAYVTEGRDGRRSREGDDAKAVRSIYFHIDRAAELELALDPAASAGKLKAVARVDGREFRAVLEGDAVVPLGTVRVTGPGYVKVDLTGIPRDSDVEALVVTAEKGPPVLSYVKDNEENRFYWGRRGPSVHLGYRMPEGRTIEWFHSELTVPEKMDPIGSYFMANGFGEGYFGIQVNSPEERRVLFSVWSPFSTDNPGEIPADQRVELLAKGKNVHGGEFGGEGSGGQSYLRYPWKAGTTYRFLNRAKPDGKGGTVYTGWFFAPEEKSWQLIASFRRPKTDKHLTGIHSFLENFADRQGWRTREGHYGNAWARDTGGEWHAVTAAGFTGDDIANRGYRLDFAGGVTGNRFFMRNGGFFDEHVKLGSRFTLPQEKGSPRPPTVELGKLESVAEGLPAATK